MTIIALATIVYTIYDAGLGVPIHTALGEGPFKTELIAAGGLTIGLALLADGLLVLAQRALTPWARVRSAEPMQRIRRGLRLHRPQRRGRRAAGLPSLVHLTLETLKVGAIGVAISLVIAVPLGVWLGHLHRGSFFAINLGNIGRALPSLACWRSATRSSASA